MPPSDGFTVLVASEIVTIPYRIYNGEVPTFPDSYASIETQIVNCLYSRHHDGAVRQRHLSSLLAAQDDWVVPFVLQLAGEYVIEILQLLASHTHTLSRDEYSRFCAHNPRFIERTTSRIISYWDCYYRRQYPRFEDYPGFQIAAALGWWTSRAGQL